VSGATTLSRSPERVADAVPLAATPRRLAPGDAGFPATLGDLASPPACLWAIGNLEMLAPPIVAIVGTRQATGYGERITREVAAAFARAGACVVSGMARGIDAVAHRAALDAGGRTIAVLGCGVDVPYPRMHAALHARIAEQGLLLSEMPPGAHPHGGSFQARNRIIAALASLVVVVEAGVKSGALITAEDGMQLQRHVAAVPGPIDSPQSEGTNLLFRDGAHPITSVADALALAGLTPPTRRLPDMATDAERRVWAALERGAGTMDELCAAARLPTAECVAVVTALELRGIVECALTGAIRRR
jgi:DNA processing protein